MLRGAEAFLMGQSCRLGVFLWHRYSNINLLGGEKYLRLRLGFRVGDEHLGSGSGLRVEAEVLVFRVRSEG